MLRDDGASDLRALTGVSRKKGSGERFAGAFFIDPNNQKKSCPAMGQPVASARNQDLTAPLVTPEKI
jgi:hypothetical protein